MDKKFEIKENMIAFGKIIGYPKWPCIILKDNELANKPKDNKEWFAVQFLYDGAFSWLKKCAIFSFDKNVEKMSQLHRNNKKLMSAIREAKHYLKIREKDSNYRISLCYKSKPQYFKESKYNQSAFKKKLVAKSKAKTSANLCLDTLGFICSNIMSDFVALSIARSLLKAGYSLAVYDTVNNTEGGLKKILGSKRDVKVCSRMDLVIINSEVIFIRLPNETVFLNTILNKLRLSKDEDTKLKIGIINITEMMPEASTKISHLLKKTGCKYLEVALFGERSQANDNNVLVLAAGDNDFFNYCYSCFTTFSKVGYFLGTPGFAIKTNCCLQIMKAVSLAMLGETMSLAENMGIDRQSFFKILKDSNVASNYLKSKFDTICQKSFATIEEPLNRLQEALNISGNVAGKLNHPIYLASTANQILNGIQDHYRGMDASISVYKNIIS